MKQHSINFKCPKCGCRDCWQELRTSGVGSRTYYADGRMWDDTSGDVDVEIPDDQECIFNCNNCDTKVIGTKQ